MEMELGVDQVAVAARDIGAHSSHLRAYELDEVLGSHVDPDISLISVGPDFLMALLNFMGAAPLACYTVRAFVRESLLIPESQHLSRAHRASTILCPIEFTPSWLTVVALLVSRLPSSAS